MVSPVLSNPVHKVPLIHRFPGFQIILPLVSAVLGYLTFPRLGISSLAWIALIPLILCVAASCGTRQAFRAGVLSGAVQSFALLIWIPNVLVSYGEMQLWLAWLLYSFLSVFLGVYTGLSCAATRICLQKLGDRGILVFPFAWVAIELLRTCTPFGGFPWLLIGYSQTESIRIAQAADITGVYGISFLIAWINAAIVLLLISERRTLRRASALAAGICGLCACLIYGELSLRRWGNVQGDLSVAILQADIAIDDPPEVAAWKSKEGYLAMARSLVPPEPDLLLLPESPSPYSFQFDTSYRDTMHELAARCSLGIIFNNISYLDNDSESEYFNSAYFLDTRGRELGRYDKIHLVPFGEYLPWKRLFFFAKTITKDVSSFSPGSVRPIVSYGGHPTNVIICFEAIFPDLTRSFVRLGSQLIVNLTNDRWYGRSAAPFQHLAMARWRAIENRRFLLRAANSGVSTIVSPTGQVEESTPILEQAILVGRFAFLSGETPYTRHGDVFAWVCAMIFLSYCMWAFWIGWLKAPTAATRRDS